ncbi:MAG: DUF4416 family protein [bacterium]
MGKIHSPQKVKLIYGVLFKDLHVWDEARQRIEAYFGPIDRASEHYPFVETAYYEEEMGTELTRCYVSLQELQEPDVLVHCKQLSNLWEEQLSESGRRRINLDPGYLGESNLVLASTKNFSQRIYLGRGIYGEVTMVYARGDFTRLPWTYLDYFHHKDFFLAVRKIHQAQLKKPSAAGE